MTLARRAAAAAALSLASAGLVGIAAQPASAADDHVLHWGFSQYLNEHLTDQSFTDGATESADGVVTLVGGTTVGDTTTYRGTAQYSFSGLYTFTFSGVAVTVDGAGEGTISADVAWDVQGDQGQVDDAVLTTFSTGDDWSDGSLTGTPDWLGVAPDNTYGSGKPVAGGSWAVDFVKALPSSVGATFYASGSGNDPKKAPAAFTASGAPEAGGPAVVTRTSYAGKRALIDVDGTGFTAVTNPGDAGVYVALAEAGKFPETDDFEDQEKVADTEWVTPAQLAAGTFSVTLDPQNKYLDPSKQYAVYTWQAHSHSNPSQDTTTPVTIDWSKLGSASALKVTRKPGKLVVSNGTAAGKVTVKLTKGKATKTAKATMTKGKATVKLPKLTRGTWKAAVTYVPSTADYRTATKTVTLKVK